MYIINEKNQILENDKLMLCLNKNDLKPAKYIIKALNCYKLIPRTIKKTDFIKINEDIKNAIIILLLAENYTPYKILNFNLTELLKKIKIIDNIFNISVSDYIDQTKQPINPISEYNFFKDFEYEKTINGYEIRNIKTNEIISYFILDYQTQELIFHKIGV